MQDHPNVEGDPWRLILGSTSGFGWLRVENRIGGGSPTRPATRPDMRVRIRAVRLVRITMSRELGKVRARRRKSSVGQSAFSSDGVFERCHGQSELPPFRASCQQRCRAGAELRDSWLLRFPLPSRPSTRSRRRTPFLSAWRATYGALHRPIADP